MDHASSPSPAPSGAGAGPASGAGRIRSQRGSSSSNSPSSCRVTAGSRTDSTTSSSSCSDRRLMLAEPMTLRQPVDRHHLGVQHRRLEGPDPHAALDERRVDRLARQLADPLVGVRAGEHHVDLDAARRRVEQQLLEALVRHEVRRHHPHAAPASRLDHHPEDRGHVVPADAGAAARHLHDRSPGRPWAGKRSASSMSGRPVSAQFCAKAAVSPSTAGPRPEVGVAPLGLVAGVAAPLLGDADAAGEGRPARRR